jgi:hypothetical protein
MARRLPGRIGAVEDTRRLAQMQQPVLPSEDDFRWADAAIALARGKMMLDAGFKLPPPPEPMGPAALEALYPEAAKEMNRQRLASLPPGGVSKPKPDTEATRIKPTIERYLEHGHPPLSPELREYRDDHQEFEREIIRSLPMMRQRFRDDPVRLRFLDEFERQFLRQPFPGGAST